MSSEATKVKSLFAELKSAKRKRFPSSGYVLDASNKKGVYLIFNRKNVVAHVGATPRAQKGIAQRLRDHLQTHSSFTRNYRPLKKDGSLLRKGYTFSYVEITDNRLLLFVEAYAVGSFCPLHIGAHINRKSTLSKRRRKKK